LKHENCARGRQGAGIPVFSEAMMRTLLISCVIAALALGVSVAEARQLRIENKRGVALEQLVITAKSGEMRKSFILAENLDAKKVTTRSVPPEHCLYDVKGVFADKSTLAAADMNLCAQTIIRLVE
jgi:hypothetical protein